MRIVPQLIIFRITKTYELWFYNNYHSYKKRDNLRSKAREPHAGGFGGGNTSNKKNTTNNISI